jgi:sulfur carrier protein ThiS
MISPRTLISEENGHTMVRVYLPGGREVDRGPEAVAIEDLLHALGINPVEVVVAKNGALTTESDITEGEDVLRVYRISHGG